MFVVTPPETHLPVLSWTMVRQHWYIVGLPSLHGHHSWGFSIHAQTVADVAPAVKAVVLFTILLSSPKRPMSNSTRKLPWDERPSNEDVAMMVARDRSEFRSTVKRASTILT